MMWRGGAELTVDTGGGQLSEKIFVEIPLGVAFGEWQFIHHVNSRNQKARFLDHKLGISHKSTKDGAIAQVAQVFKHLISNQGQHLFPPKMPEA